VSSAYDAIVVGSGFGGAVTAAKLTTSGFGTLLLEKGHRWRRPRHGDASENLHLGAPLANLVDERGYPKAAGDADRWGNPQYVTRQSTDLRYIFFENPRSGARSGGLFEDYIGDRMMVTVARGYGGGSLVYSQVHLRAPSETFEEPGWTALPFSRPALDPYYDRVERMLLTFEGRWDELPRRGAVIADAMARAGVSCEPARLGNFRIAREADRGRPPVMNPWGRPVEPCNGCGFCTFGCIFDARQNLTLNYLAVAEDSGRLDVRTDAAAWTIEPAPRGYRVHWRDERTGAWRADEARVVVVSAGAINSPELLLRCRDLTGSLPALSRHVGRHVSGNGDAIFGVLFPNLAADFKADVFKGHVFSIVSYHWWRTGRFIIEDAGTAPLGAAKYPLRREGGDGRFWGPQIKDLLRAHYATDMVGIGGMGIDGANGRVTIDDSGKAHLDWVKKLVPGDRTYELLEGIRAACRQIAEAGGGELLHEQEWSDDRRMLGVHPLGGCRMAASRAAGVVDAAGEAFGYPGLYVVDGSIMPSAIGVNPSLTIAAIAEKLSDGIRDALGERVGQRPRVRSPA
jgi:cholesterol oxidase